MQAGSATYYEVLGVPVDATPEEILNAYREYLLESTLSADALETDMLDRVRAAFDVLNNQEARQKYDRELASMSAEGKGGAVAMDALGAGKAARFEFVGDGAAYFRIWIVNLCLSILSLGIYSAWAKVRREQYFHRNTLLDGSGFDYHGQPLAILKGRGLALALVGILSLTEKLGPAPYLAALAMLFLAAPWLIIRALSFRAANTSYRGLRFSFNASYGQMAKLIFVNGLLSLVTFGLWLPRFTRDWRKFVVDHAAFGSTGFACELKVGRVYRIYLLPLSIACFSAFVLGALSVMIGESLLLIPVGIIALGLYFLLPAYIAVSLSNAVWSSSRLGAHRFVSEIPISLYIRMVLGNWLAIVFSLGIFIPWAQVRMARLRTEHLKLMADGQLDAFIAGEQRNVSALGEGASDMFAIDLAI
ncbi:MAG: DUF898 family protein [Rhodocyclales bacterium GT-UBC]|nr:MAG: DUF898 family protein [Rhodocyclales bacterium GT-UBC]